MSASDNLNPQQFFHGTTADLQEGETLQPGSKVGRGRGRSVWLTPSADSARVWAETRAHKDGNFERTEDGWGTRTTVPVHVYEVAAPEAVVDRNGHVKAPSARVLRRVDVDRDVK